MAVIHSFEKMKPQLVYINNYVIFKKSSIFKAINCTLLETRIISAAAACSTKAI